MEEKNRIQEEWLVLRCQLGESDAYKELLTLMEKRLFYFIRRLVGSEADALDVLQEVWLTVFRKINKLRDPKTFRSWIYRIAHDLAITVIRKEIHQEKLQGSYGEANLSNDESSFPEFEDSACVHRALDELNSAHREVLTLFFLEEMSYEEIGHVVGCHVGTVKSRIHYAKKELRDLLEDKDDIQK